MGLDVMIADRDAARVGSVVATGPLLGRSSLLRLLSLDGLWRLRSSTSAASPTNGELLVGLGEHGVHFPLTLYCVAHVVQLHLQRLVLVV